MIEARVVCSGEGGPIVGGFPPCLGGSVPALGVSRPSRPPLNCVLDARRSGLSPGWTAGRAAYLTRVATGCHAISLTVRRARRQTLSSVGTLLGHVAPSASCRAAWDCYLTSGDPPPAVVPEMPMSPRQGSGPCVWPPSRPRAVCGVDAAIGATTSGSASAWAETFTLTPLRAVVLRARRRPCPAPRFRVRSGPEGSSNSEHRCRSTVPDAARFLP